MKANSTLLPFASFERRSVPLVDFHMHTTWTDGKHSVQQMYDAAVAAGLSYILYSEHARRSSGHWFPGFAAEVRALPTGPCKAFVGVESKIADFDGSLDLSNDIRQCCDLVMGSVHRFPGEIGIEKGRPPPLSLDEVTDTEFRLARAAGRTGAIDILGHPFGMTYRRFSMAPSEHLIEELVCECAKHGVAFEVNARYHDDPWRLIDLCRRHDAAVALGSNAHHRDEVGAITRMLRDKP